MSQGANKNSKQPKVNDLKRGTGNASDYSFSSDWLRGWCEFSWPITEHSKIKSVQFRIIFGTQLKIVLILRIYSALMVSTTTQYRLLYQTARSYEVCLREIDSCNSFL